MSRIVDNAVPLNVDLEVPDARNVLWVFPEKLVVACGSAWRYRFPFIDSDVDEEAAVLIEDVGCLAVDLLAGE